MEEEIRNFIANVLEDVKALRESDMEVKDRLPIEIMALNAAANAYAKVYQVLLKSATPNLDD